MTTHAEHEAFKQQMRAQRCNTCRGCINAIIVMMFAMKAGVPPLDVTQTMQCESYPLPPPAPPIQFAVPIWDDPFKNMIWHATPTPPMEKPMQSVTNVVDASKTNGANPGAPAKTEIVFQDAKVVFRGKQIVLPEGMSYGEGRHWLTVREEEENQTVDLSETIPVFPLEGAYAFAKALDNRFGFYEKVSIPGFFGSSPPQMVSVDIGYGKTTQVPWGRVHVPGFEGYLETSIGVDGNRPVFAVAAHCKQRCKAMFEEIVALTRKLARKHSIYRGHAVRMHFPDPEKSEKWTLGTAPKFMDLSHIRVDELILPRDSERLVRTTLLTPIRKTEISKKHGVPIKRGVLLEGPYGVGKTMTADVVAKTCAENGWTFIYLDNVKQLGDAILFARQYQPAVIFAEDIDRVVTGARSEEMDKILNTMDGIDTKHDDIMVVLTTNHVENIHPAALRPGRLDVVISLRAPDAEAAERLVRLYARGRLADSEDLTEVRRLLAGQIPATIRETVERSKLAGIERIESEDEPLDIRAIDIETTAQGMLNHMELLNRKPSKDDDAVVKFSKHMGEAFAEGMKKATNGHAAPVAKA